MLVKHIESNDTDYLNTLLNMIDNADWDKLWKIEHRIQKL